MEFTDRQLLDYLQRRLDEKKYTGLCVLRESTTGRGWRLHETSEVGSVASVREAIARELRQETQS